MNPPFTLGVPTHRDRWVDKISSVVRARGVAGTAAGVAIWFAPLSIAISEVFLGAALLARMTRAAKHEASAPLRRTISFWAIWAATEVASWLFSPDRAAGSGELRHLVLIASLFLILPALGRLHDHLTVWRGLFLTSTIGALSVVCTFIVRLVEYRHTIRTGGDPAFYLRNGGLLHHWMIFAVVEAMIFGALLEYRATYPRDRGWTTPALLIHGVAIICSLTRGLWFACLVLIAIHLVSHRPKSAWFLLGIPSLALLMMFTPVRQRVEESLQPDYSSNMERIQMVRVGWRMIRRHPLAGVGAGRVEKLYPSYLEPGELLPAYHGHLHNNPLQLAAEFGLPALLSAVLFVIALWRNLWTALRRATRSSEIFLARAALLGVVGFLVTGLTDYTYGHSLGLILFSYVSLAPLLVHSDSHLPARKDRTMVLQ